MHDSHEGETEYYDRAIGDPVQSKRLFDAKKSPETIEHLPEEKHSLSQADGAWWYYVYCIVCLWKQQKVTSFGGESESSEFFYPMAQ